MSIPLPNLPHWAFADKHDLVPSEVRTDIKRYGESYAAAVSAAKDERIKVLEDALRGLVGEIDSAPNFARSHIHQWFPRSVNAARAALGGKT